RDPADGRRGARAAAQGGAGTAARRLRLHHHRLPARAVALTLNALTAADSVIVPMQCEYYALEGLSALMETIEALRQQLNPALEIEGVLRTMFDVRNNLANAVSAELTEHFGDRVFRTIVPRNVRLAEAPSHGQSIVGYDRASL